MHASIRPSATLQDPQKKEKKGKKGISMCTF